MTAGIRALVTGGAGFIGSALVRRLVTSGARQVTTVDALTYAGHLASLVDVLPLPHHRFERVNITDAPAMARIFAEAMPDVVYHLAAESHVDRSIDGPRAFVDTNVTGTFVLLEAARRYFDTLSGEARERFRLVHVSTDEVFGALGESGVFVEDSPYRPTSPYAATKAAADHLVRAWHRTFGLPVLVTNCSNNYGPRQFPEKLIPRMIVRALAGEPLPVYGTGGQVRDWLHVEDHVTALQCVAHRGHVGETYLVGGGCEIRNLDLVEQLCDVLDALHPRRDGHSYRKQITFVADRPGHDFRYALDDTKVRVTLGWHPSRAFTDGLRETVAWYLANRAWWRPLLSGANDRASVGPTASADANTAAQTS